MITPPVAIASYPAAAVAGSEPIWAGWESIRLGARVYIVPFIFFYLPSLLLQGSLFNISWKICSTVLGSLLLGIALRDYLYQKVLVPFRVLLNIAYRPSLHRI